MTRPLLLAALLAGCTLSKHPTVQADSPAATAVSDVAAFLATPGPIEHEAVVSARWAVPAKGLIDLHAPAASDLDNADIPIVLPVHLLTHPDAGLFVVDTGISTEQAQSGAGPVRGLMRAFAGSMEPVAPLAELLAGRSPAGVLITHMHFDHILGLTDVPRGTPIYTGPGETEESGLNAAMMRRSTAAALDGHSALHTWNPGTAVSLGPVAAAWDVIGDGSLWALSTPGHTTGSMAYLARTTDGPVLMTGDTSHTLWGWEHGVTPGTYTADHDSNRESLRQLKALEELLPTLTVYVGHELDGADTGVAAMGR